MRDWITNTIGEFIDFNPSEKLQKNKIAKKIPMDKLGTFERKIKGFVFAEYQSGPKFRNNDTLVAKITPCLENGKTAFVNILDSEEVAFGSSEFIVLRNNKLSDAKFIYYLARSPYFREKAISCMEGTSGRKRVNETALKHLNRNRYIFSTLKLCDFHLVLRKQKISFLLFLFLFFYFFLQLPRTFFTTKSCCDCFCFKRLLAIFTKFRYS